MAKTYIRSTRTRYHRFDDCPDYLDKYLKTLEKEKKTLNTITSYYLTVRQYIRYLVMVKENTPVELYSHIKIQTVPVSYLDVMPDMADKYKTFLIEENAAPTTIAHASTVLKAFYGYLKRSKLAACNPFADQLLSETPNTPVTFVTAEDKRKIKEAAYKTMLPERDHLIVVLLLELGLKLSELCALNVSDIVMDGEKHPTSLKIRNAADIERILSLPSPVSESLTAYLLERKINLAGGPHSNADPLFMTLTRTHIMRLTPRGIQKCLDRIMLYADLFDRPYNASTFRLTAIRDAAKEYNGNDLPAYIQERFGFTTAIATRKMLRSITM